MIPKLLAFLCVVTCFKLTVAQIELIPEVMTDEGLVKGDIKKSRVGKEFFRFLSIPYAEKPKRFEVRSSRGLVANYGSVEYKNEILAAITSERALGWPLRCNKAREKVFTDDSWEFRCICWS